MQYLLLIYGEEARWNEIEQKERDAVLQEYMDFTKSIAQVATIAAGMNFIERREPRLCVCGTERELSQTGRLRRQKKRWEDIT